MAGVFYKHTEWKSVTDGPPQEEEVTPLHSGQSSFKVLQGFHHNGCEVILTCEDLGIKQGEK